jgi:hypothetical protein
MQTPPTNVIDNDDRKIRTTALDVRKQLLESCPIADIETATAGIDISSDDLKPTLLRI